MKLLLVIQRQRFPHLFISVPASAIKEPNWWNRVIRRRKKGWCVEEMAKASRSHNGSTDA